MTITQLIAELQYILAERGDVQVYMADQESSYFQPLSIGSVFFHRTLNVAVVDS